MDRTNNNKGKDTTDGHFVECYKTNFHKVVYYANSFLNDNEAAKDVSSEVFLNVWKRRQNVDFETDMLPYLLVLARNYCLNMLKKEKVECRYKQETTFEFQKRVLNYTVLYESGITSLYSSDIKMLVKEAFEQMPEKVSKTFRLNRNMNMKYSEIAELENVSVKAIEKRMMTALKILRVKLKDYLPK